jgi:hypothetical protein
VVAKEVRLVRDENLAAAAAAEQIQVFVPSAQGSSSADDKSFDRQEAGSKLERISQWLSPSKRT